ncbi:MAG TPA: zinc-binding dehydrogenase [Ilumatobacteraceae bacterium]|nr:zinc-binding dehydrogenase [Ilumatobacteraceae bacterium]
MPRPSSPSTSSTPDWNSPASSERPTSSTAPKRTRSKSSGVDYALDTTGIPALIRQAVDALRQRGTAAILGASRPDAVLDIPANALMQSCKTIMGVVEGDSVPDVFVPQLLDLHMQGRFPIDRLVKFYDFDQINQAAADAESGATVKPILRIA